MVSQRGNQNANVNILRRNNILHLASEIYGQREDIVMGLSLFPVISNIYMEYFMKMALRTIPLSLSTWIK